MRAVQAPTIMTDDAVAGGAGPPRHRRGPARADALPVAAFLRPSRSRRPSATIARDMALPPPLDRTSRSCPSAHSRARSRGSAASSTRKSARRSSPACSLRTIRAARDAPSVSGRRRRQLRTRPSCGDGGRRGRRRAARSPASGLNGALQDGRAWAVGHGAIGPARAAGGPAVRIAADEVDALLQRASDASRPRGEPLVGARSRTATATGTNALLVAPPAAIPFAFGPGSRRDHEAAARHAGARFVEIDGPLSDRPRHGRRPAACRLRELAHEGAARPGADGRATPLPVSRASTGRGPPTAPASIGQLRASSRSRASPRSGRATTCRRSSPTPSRARRASCPSSPATSSSSPRRSSPRPKARSST